jgi:hypothetical protein
VSSPDVVADISNGDIDGVIVVLASCNGGSCFVAPEYDRDEDCAMCVDINGNNVLFVEVLVRVGSSVKLAYTLLPSPVP